MDYSNLIEGKEALAKLGIKYDRKNGSVHQLERAGISVAKKIGRGRGAIALVEISDVERVMTQRSAAANLGAAVTVEQPSAKSRPGETLRAVRELTARFDKLQERLDAFIDQWTS